MALRSSITFRSDGNIEKDGWDQGGVPSHAGGGRDEGGIEMARPADRTTIGVIVRLLEADQPLVDCFRADGGTCTPTPAWKLKGPLFAARQAFLRKLDRITLLQCACPWRDRCRGAPSPGVSPSRQKRTKNARQDHPPHQRSIFLAKNSIVNGKHSCRVARAGTLQSQRKTLSSYAHAKIFDFEKLIHAVF